MEPYCPQAGDTGTVLWRCQFKEKNLIMVFISKTVKNCAKLTYLCTQVLFSFLTLYINWSLYLFFLMTCADH